MYVRNYNLPPTVAGLGGSTGTETEKIPVQSFPEPGIILNATKNVARFSHINTNASANANANITANANANIGASEKNENTSHSQAQPQPQPQPDSKSEAESESEPAPMSTPTEKDVGLLAKMGQMVSNYKSGLGGVLSGIASEDVMIAALMILLLPENMGAKGSAESSAKGSDDENADYLIPMLLAALMLF